MSLRTPEYEKGRADGLIEGAKMEREKADSWRVGYYRRIFQAILGDPAAWEVMKEWFVPTPDSNAPSAPTEEKNL